MITLFLSKIKNPSIQVDFKRCFEKFSSSIRFIGKGNKEYKNPNRSVSKFHFYSKNLIQNPEKEILIWFYIFYSIGSNENGRNTRNIITGNYWRNLINR